MTATDNFGRHNGFVEFLFFFFFLHILRSGTFETVLLSVFAAPVNDHWDSSEKMEQRKKGHVETCGGFCLVLASFKSLSFDIWLG